MTTDELNEWFVFYKLYRNGVSFSDWEWNNFIRLNHLVMESSHEIHNKNMLGKQA